MARPVSRRTVLRSIMGGFAVAAEVGGVGGLVELSCLYIVSPLVELRRSRLVSDQAAKQLVFPPGEFSVHAPRIHPNCGRPPVDGQCPVEKAVKEAIRDALGEPRNVVPKQVPYSDKDSVICIGGPVYNRRTEDVLGKVDAPRFRWMSATGLESRFEYGLARVSGSSKRQIFGKTEDRPLNAIVTRNRELVVAPDGKHDYLLVTRLPIELGDKPADIVILAGVGGAGTAGVDTLLYGRQLLDLQPILSIGSNGLPRHFQAIFRVSEFGVDKEHWTVPKKIELVTGKRGEPRPVTILSHPPKRRRN